MWLYSSVLGHLCSWRENWISTCASMSIWVFCWGVASAGEIERHFPVLLSSVVQEFKPQLEGKTHGPPCPFQQRKGLNPLLDKMNPTYWIVQAGWRRLCKVRGTWIPLGLWLILLFLQIPTIRLEQAQHDGVCDPHSKVCVHLLSPLTGWPTQARASTRCWDAENLNMVHVKFLQLI